MSDTQYPEPFFRTLVTYEVITQKEAFNGAPDHLAAEVTAGIASAKLVLRAVENLLPINAGEKLIDHGEDLFFFGLPALPALPADGRPRTTCGCGFDIVYIGYGEWQHDAAPYFWGDDHDAQPDGPSAAAEEAAEEWDRENSDG